MAGADLVGADLAGADLAGADLAGADLQSAPGELRIFNPFEDSTKQISTQKSSILPVSPE